MENYRLPILIASILGFALIIFVILLNVRQIQLIRGDPQLLSVAATAKIDSIPDTAIVTLGVVSDAQTAQAAKDQNTNKMKQVISFIKRVGVDDKNIQTSQFNISPSYNYSNQQQTLIGYQANQTITVKVKVINKSAQQLETIVDGAVANGANQIQGISFSFADNDILIQNVRKQAIENAKSDAQRIANDAGLKLGRIVNVITSDSNSPTPRFMALAKSNSSQIEPGSQEVSATITAVFEIR